MRPRSSSSTPLLRTALFLALCGVSAACAVRPGTSESLEAAQRETRQMRAAAYAEFQQLVGAWVEAVEQGAVERAAALYEPRAVVRLGYPARGPEVGTALADWIQDVERVMVGPADFDFSEQLAYGTLRILVVSREGDRRGGRMVVVARQRDGIWRIRSQLIHLPPR